MASPGISLENPITGERIVFRTTARETGGARVVIDHFLKPHTSTFPEDVQRSGCGRATADGETPQSVRLLAMHENRGPATYELTYFDMQREGAGSCHSVDSSPRSSSSRRCS